MYIVQVFSSNYLLITCKLVIKHQMVAQLERHPYFKGTEG